jgi:hypothetical protein
VPVSSLPKAHRDWVVDRLGPLAMDTTKKVVQRQARQKAEDLGVLTRPDIVHVQGWRYCFSMLIDLMGRITRSKMIKTQLQSALKWCLIAWTQ